MNRKTNFDDDFDIDKRIEKRINARHVGGWWYIRGHGKDNKGRMRPFLYGPYGDYDTAQYNKGRIKGLLAAEIFEHESSDLSRVNQQARANRLKQGESIGDVLERVRHKL